MGEAIQRFFERFMTNYVFFYTTPLDLCSRVLKMDMTPPLWEGRSIRRIV